MNMRITPALVGRLLGMWGLGSLVLLVGLAAAELRMPKETCPEAATEARLGVGTIKCKDCVVVDVVHIIGPTIGTERGLTLYLYGSQLLATATWASDGSFGIGREVLVPGQTFLQEAAFLVWVRERAFGIYHNLGP